MKQIHVLLIQDAEDVWAAQIIEKDICAQGSTPEDALMALAETLAAERLLDAEFPGHFDSIEPAPIQFWPPAYIPSVPVSNTPPEHTSLRITVADRTDLPAQTVTRALGWLP